MKTAILLLLSALGLSAQTCTITSPTSAQLFQYAGWINLTATVSSAPTAWKATWSVDYQIVGNAYARNTNQHPVDAGEAWTQPFQVGWNTGLLGDGAHTASVAIYDIFGTSLASCTQAFTVRVEGMSNQLFSTVPSGTGETNGWVVQTFDQSNNGQDWYVDGYPMEGINSAGNSACGRGMAGATNFNGKFDSTCFPNGAHLLMWDYDISSVGTLRDPYLLPLTFTSSGVSGNNITLQNGAGTPGHYSLQGSVVTLGSTGTLPSPLNAGSQWYWETSTTNPSNTVSSLAVSGSNLTVTLSGSSGATGGTTVYIRNTHYTDSLGAGCDGLYTASSGSGSSFVVPLPSTCPNGTITAATAAATPILTMTGTLPPNGATVTISGFTGMWAALNNGNGVAMTLISPGVYSTPCPNSGCASYGAMTGTPVFGPPITSQLGSLEIDVNPYFVIYNSLTSISLSASCSPCTDGPHGQHPLPGTVVTLTGGGTGTHTVTQRIRSPYWSNPTNGMNGDLAGSSSTGTGGPANVYQKVTFSNGSAPMELEIPYWQIYLQTGGATVSICPKIKNTDLSFTTPACNASGLTYTLVNDGGFTASSVISVSSLGVVTPVGVGVAQISVAANSTYAGNTNGLQTQIVYAQVCSGPCPFPTFTHSGAVSSTFSPGNSFVANSNWFLDPKSATGWNANVPSRPLFYGQMMQHANINTFLIAPDASNANLGDPSATSCFSGSFPSTLHGYENTFATSVPGFPMYYELDLESTHWGVNGAGYLAAFVNDIGGWRHTCYTNFVNQLATEARTYRSFSYDELNAHMVGEAPFRNPNLGSTDFPTITVSGGVATYAVTETFTGVWNQAAGTGSWVKVAGAVTNTCLNGWFPVTGITTIGGVIGPNTGSAFTTASTCANGIYTESTAQLYHYQAVSNPGGVENATTIPRVAGPGTCCSGSSNQQNWDSTYFTQIVVSGCNGTTCLATFSAQSHGIVTGQAIRVWGSVNLLNVVAPITASTNTFTITYNVANGTLPSNGTYTSSNDASLFFTVDGNLPPTPFLSLQSILAGPSGRPAITWAAIGVTYSNILDPGIQQWEGRPSYADASWLYIPQTPTAVLGSDATPWQWMTYSFGTSGKTTAGYQLSGPRSMLWNGVSDSIPICQGFGFNPTCDRPQFVFTRPEGITAQLMGMQALGVSSFRTYGAGFYWSLLSPLTNGLGWNFKGTGRDGGISPYTTASRWSSAAHTDQLMKAREDTFLQPPCNKQFLGKMFTTDCHTNATYGNQVTVVSSSEMPYGAFAVNLSPIAGGSTIIYKLDGYTLTVANVAGNPSSITQEWAPSPGVVWVIVSQPPGYTALDVISFPAKVGTLPYGAAKYMLQVGYYPEDMRSDPVTDCTSGCTISIDHHNLPAYYRVIYADSNSLPVATGSPNTIASQGLY